MTVKATINARVITNKQLQKSKACPVRKFKAKGKNNRLSGKLIMGLSNGACKYFRMALALDKPVEKVIPGQFVHIMLDSREHILPRPFTIFNVIGRRTVEIVYQVKGQGTELMSRLKRSDKVRVLCPLGNGFVIDKKDRVSVLVGGGIGTAGLYLLLKEMNAQRIKNIHLFIGARTKSDLCLLPDFRKLCQDIVISTEDGSFGAKGFITTVLDKFLNRYLLPTTYSDLAIYSCGPSGMSEAIRKIAVAKNIPAQISLEERMGCGVGLCRVCVCKTIKGYSTVCEDGPVFEANQLIPLTH